MNAVGILELTIFLYLAYRSIKKPSGIVDVAIYNYICEIINSKLWGSVSWLNIGINLYSGDFFVLLLLFIMLARKRLTVKKNIAVISIFIFMVMALRSAIAGAFSFGMSSLYIGDTRKYLYFWVSLCFFSVSKIRYDWYRIEKKLDKLFLIVTIYIAFCLLVHYAGIPFGYFSDDRPLLSDYAIIYAIYIGYRWYRELILKKNLSISLSTVIYTVMLILNRYNTTWVALSGAVVVIILGRRLDKNSLRLGFKFWREVLVIVIGGVLLFNVLQNTNVMGELNSNLSKFDISGNNTLTSRIEVWQAILATYKGYAAFIGYPFGNGYHVLFRGIPWQYQPHNGYIELIGRTGIIGLACIIIIVIWIIKRSLKDKVLWPIALVVPMLIYWGAYSITLEQGILIGICLNSLFRESSNETRELL